MGKVRCPDCKGRFEIELSEFDEGDLINCPECNLELVVEVVEGRPKIKTAKEKDLDESDFGAVYDE